MPISPAHAEGELTTDCPRTSPGLGPAIYCQDPDIQRHHILGPSIGRSGSRLGGPDGSHEDQSDCGRTQPARAIVSSIAERRSISMAWCIPPASLRSTLSSPSFPSSHSSPCSITTDESTTCSDWSASLSTLIITSRQTSAARTCTTSSHMQVRLAVYFQFLA